jgi:hypothetical protein
VARLRTCIEWALIDRLTAITEDREVIGRTVDRTFDEFRAAVKSAAAINWLQWIVAAAMTIAAEEARELEWVDRVAGLVSGGTRHEQRMFVFRIVLTLNGRCQFSLLRRAARLKAMTGDYRTCFAELARRLKVLDAS